MKRADSGDILKYKGALYTVIGYTEEKTLILEPILPNKVIVCPHCGKEIEEKEILYEVESCRNFQGGAEAVSTLKE